MSVEQQNGGNIEMYVMYNVEIKYFINCYAVTFTSFSLFNNQTAPISYENPVYF